MNFALTPFGAHMDMSLNKPCFLIAGRNVQLAYNPAPMIPVETERFLDVLLWSVFIEVFGGCVWLISDDVSLV